jgi:multiple sugar transport system permease protein
MMTIQARLGRIVLYAFLFAVTGVVLFPILWMVLTSIKPDGEIYSFVPNWLPTKLDWSHYEVVWFEKNFWLYFLNSIFVASVTAIVSTVVAVLGGYALARFSFRGRNTLSAVVLMIYLVPIILLALPFYLALSAIGLYDTRLGLILAVSTYAVPFAVWVLRGFFAQIPPEIEEAAMVDGASRLGALYWVVLPVAVPGILATALFAFILAWDDYLFALIVIDSDELRTLPLAIGLLAR